MDSLKKDLDRISALGPPFYALNMGIRVDLLSDMNASQLRTTLMKFNTPMKAASEEMREAFISGRHFYIHNLDQLIPTQNQPGPATKEQVNKLLEPDFQGKIIKRARDAAAQAAKASKIIREEVLPVLPQLEYDLQNYVDNYLSRVSMTEDRQKSWVPMFMQNLLAGSISPTPWETEKVRELPQLLSTGSILLRKLPAFLDNFQLHFRRLSELQTQQISDLGYRTFDDLTRLYEDRLKCNRVLAAMDNSWYSAVKAFGAGVMKWMPT